MVGRREPSNVATPPASRAARDKLASLRSKPRSKAPARHSHTGKSRAQHARRHAREIRDAYIASRRVAHAPSLQRPSHAFRDVKVAPPRRARTDHAPPTVLRLARARRALRRRARSRASGARRRPSSRASSEDRVALELRTVAVDEEGPNCSTRFSLSVRSYRLSGGDASARCRRRG